MKIGVMSDTHDHRDNAARAVELFLREKVELVIHAGDFVSPFIFKELGKLPCPLQAVFGNNDGDRSALRKLIAPLGTVAGLRNTFEAAEKRFLLVHDFGDAVGAGDPSEFDYIVFGHTHVPEVRREGGITWINPGECAGWVNGRPTVALLDPAGGQVEILDLPVD